MMLLSYYSVATFSNVYIAACSTTGEAVVVDPARFEAPLLEFIESNGLSVRYVLVTRPEVEHEQGIRTLRRIYDAQVCAGVPEVAGFQTLLAEDGTTIELGSQRINTIGLSAHSHDARAFRCGHLLFTGPVLTAGDMATEHPGYSRVLLRDMIEQRLLSLPADTVVLPRSGPPTTIGLERETNIALRPPQPI